MLCTRSPCLRLSPGAKEACSAQRDRPVAALPETLCDGMGRQMNNECSEMDVDASHVGGRQGASAHRLNRQPTAGVIVVQLQVQRRARA